VAYRIFGQVKKSIIYIAMAWTLHLPIFTLSRSCLPGTVAKQPSDASDTRPDARTPDPTTRRTARSRNSLGYADRPGLSLLI